MSRKFPLESVKRLRIRQRDLAAGEVAEIHRAIQIFQEQMDQIASELASLLQDRKAISTGELSVSELLDSQRYEMQLNLNLQNMSEKMLILKREKNKREEKLLGRQKDLKAIEHLEEEHREKLKLKDAKLLQSRLDEWANTRVIQNRVV